MRPAADFNGVAPPGASAQERPEPVRIWLLGGFRVSVGPRRIERRAWRLRKAAALVKLLALTPGHRLHREQAIEALWPRLGRKAAANNLRHTLHATRRVLEPAPAVTDRYLRLEGEQVSLCPEGQLWVDSEAFESAAVAARRAREPAAYRAALDLYSGELLPEDRYEEWAEDRRVELRRVHLTLLFELAELYEKRGELAPAIEALERAVKEEPLHEESYTSLMRVYALSGQRQSALGCYERLREALAGELGAEPGVASRRLRDDVAAGRFPPDRGSPGPPNRETTTAPRHNLPASRTSFVGREWEAVEIKRALAMTRLLMLTGAGGSGKTRLALKVAEDLVGIYPGGVWFVELAPLADGELVAQEVAEALEVRVRAGRSLTEEIADALRGDEQTLLILDNCEHLVEATARLADALLAACPNLRVLATSREPLGVGGEALWRVPSLSVPGGDRLPEVGELTGYDAVRLFLDRARLRLPDFDLTPKNAPAVTEVCRRLEGMPLAIELATARIGTLAVEDVAGRLEDSLGILTSGPRTAEPRQRTMRATLEWSHRLLSEPEQRIFRRLSAFAGGWTLEAAEAVGSDGEGEADVVDVLPALVDRSLVAAEAVETLRATSLRYRMLEPVRQYARERLEESGESDAVCGRHAAFFLALAEEAEPELKGERQQEWLGRMEAEHDNFRAALSWALERGEAELGVRLSAALVEFWHLHVHHDEARRWLDEALAKQDVSSSARMKALERASFLAWEQADYERAVALGEEALLLARRLGDKARAANVLTNLGSVAMSRMEVGRASALLQEAVSLWKESEDNWGLAHSVYTLGMVAVVQRDHDQALARHEESLALAQRSGDEVGIVRSLGLGALTALVGGDHGQTYALSKATLELSRRLGIDHYTASCLSIFGASACLQGRPFRAVRLWGAEVTLREAMGIPRMPVETSFHKPYFDAVRDQLDDEAWEKAWSEGQAMDMDEAIEYALSEEEDGPSRPLAPEQRAGEEPAALTRREEEVAALVARGLTNRQVAAELSISEHTVATHIGRILKKLALSSRSRLAAWVTERGLPSSTPD
jgi:predicted ATPase/DNA-binding SARP family transcriptional activator/DNA-binding CsgD family transcriptional regulator